jgi:hypothetical protein
LGRALAGTGLRPLPVAPAGESPAAEARSVRRTRHHQERMPKLQHTLIMILAYGAAFLFLAATIGYVTFRLLRAELGPTASRRLLPVAFAFVVAPSVVLVAVWTFARWDRARVPALPIDAPPVTSRTDSFMALVAAVFLGAAILALLRRLPRKRAAGESKPSGPGMTHFAP